MKARSGPLSDSRVAVARLPGAEYPDSAVTAGIEQLAGVLGWSDAAGPFGSLIPPGAKVLVKPNWVTHRNDGPWGLHPLVTHPSLVRAVAEGALRSELAQLVIGDAPLQRCDFTALMRATELDAWAEELNRRDGRFRGAFDFRRTTSVFENGVRVPTERQSALSNFVLFDLGVESLLESITSGSASFRVTRYDPSYMARTHGPGRHQYLVSRHVVEADVVINLPKLKTHRKAGVTCALKNLIGINGNKEFLPHHRVGGSGTGGDCYPGASVTKRALEFVLDRENASTSGRQARWWHEMSRYLSLVLRLRGDQLGVDGAWSGNDTIWRTCLDLNRVLLYGRPDGTLAEEPQRRVIHVVDAVVAGQGDGPLAPEPLPLGLMVGSSSAAAVDWVGAQILGYDPERIPIAREAFGTFRWPLVTFTPDQIELIGEVGLGITDFGTDCISRPCSVRYPPGWNDAADRFSGRRMSASRL